MRARYYNPGIGRFISGDSYPGDASAPLSLNYYTYCYNNPIRYIDYSGNIPIISDIIHWGESKVNKQLNRFSTDTAEVGSFFLNFEKDKIGQYHAKFDCWQQYFGYNDLYDLVFYLGTDMKKAKFDFNHNGQDYILWAWKGDYINLGAGAELGIYKSFIEVGSSNIQWKVDKALALPMTLKLQYRGVTIMYYNPSKKQWWITGFDPYYKDVKATDLTATFTIDFSANIDTRLMFKSFFKKYGDENSDDWNPRWKFNGKTYEATFEF